MSTESQIQSFRDAYAALQSEIGKVIVGHTAIVESNDGGGTMHILQSNVNGVLTVSEAVMPFADMTQGTIWVYRPTAA